MADIELAVAAESFARSSETFIRAHVRTIAPGRTLVLCNDGRQADALDCPVFADMDPWWRPAEKTTRGRLVRFARRHWRRFVYPSVQGKAYRRLAAILQTQRPRALLAEYGPTGCLLMGLCRDLGIPLYVHFHGYDASGLLRRRYHVRHYRTLFERAHGIITPSQFLARRLAGIGCPPEKLHVSPCGIDPDLFLPTRREPGHIVAVGRLVEKKAPDHVIEAFGQIASRFPDARLDMIGDGPLWARCVQRVESLGLGERVTLHGAQDSDRVAVLMRGASIFVQHSVTTTRGETEGLPVSILEAMSCAVPVVSTVHSGIPEAVDHGATGYLVAEHDVRGMADAIGVLLSDPSRATAMGHAGRARVQESFTIGHTRDRLRAIMKLPCAPVPRNPHITAAA